MPKWREKGSSFPRSILSLHVAIGKFWQFCHFGRFLCSCFHQIWEEHFPGRGADGCIAVVRAPCTKLG